MPNNTTRGVGVPIVVVDKAAEIALYDAMPARFRALIDSLPVLQRVSKVEEYRRALGDAAAYDRIVESFLRQFPGWEPPDTAAVASAPSSRRGRRTPRGAIRVPTSD